MGTVTGMQPSRQEEEGQKKIEGAITTTRAIQCRRCGRKRRSEGDDNKTNNGENEGGDNKIKAEVAPYRTNRLILNVNETNEEVYPQARQTSICLHVLMNIAETYKLNGKCEA